jgi:hypothetical protein
MNHCDCLVTRKNSVVATGGVVTLGCNLIKLCS